MSTPITAKKSCRTRQMGARFWLWASSPTAGGLAQLGTEPPDTRRKTLTTDLIRHAPRNRDP